MSNVVAFKRVEKKPEAPAKVAIEYAELLAVAAGEYVYLNCKEEGTGNGRSYTFLVEGVLEDEHGLHFSCFWGQFKLPIFIKKGTNQTHRGETMTRVPTYATDFAVINDRMKDAVVNFIANVSTLSPTIRRHTALIQYLNEQKMMPSAAGGDDGLVRCVEALVRKAVNEALQSNPFLKKGKT